MRSPRIMSFRCAELNRGRVGLLAARYAGLAAHQEIASPKISIRFFCSGNCGLASLQCRVYTKTEFEDFMTRYFVYALLLVGLCNGCFKIKTEHKVEPIHITMDVNLKVQRDLEEFLDLED